MERHDHDEPRLNAIPWLILMATTGAVAFSILAGEWVATAEAAAPASSLRASVDFLGTEVQQVAALVPRMEWIRTALTLTHVAGLLAGFGFTLFVDIYLLRHLYSRPLDRTALAIVEHGSRFIGYGLALLWISGLGFLALYAAATPDKLANPKIWAKLAIVCMLTLNGFYLHSTVLPALSRRIGRPVLAGLTPSSALVFLAAGTISILGWSFPTAFGLVAQLNHVFEAHLLFAAYLGSAGLLVCAGVTFHWLYEKTRIRSDSARRSRP